MLSFYDFQFSDDPWLKKALNVSTVLDENPLQAFKDGIVKLCLDLKFALLANDFNYKSAECEILKIPSPAFTDWVLMFLRPESPYRAIFNRL